MSGIELIIPVLGHIGQNITNHYMNEKASKQFVKQIEEFMHIYTNEGFLEPVPAGSGSSSHVNSPTGWKTRPGKDLGLFHLMYPEIREAIDQTAIEHTNLTELLQRPVLIDVASSHVNPSVRERIGEGWPAGHRQTVLEEKGKNPFTERGATMDRDAVGRHCKGVMEKSRRSPGLAGAVIFRVLGLARVCGVFELGTADLLEIMAHSGNYEYIARSYIAMALGTDEINSFGYLLPNSQTLGKMQSDMATSGMLNEDGLIQVGTVQNGKANLTYPCPAEQLEDVEIKFKSASSQATQDEPIFMDSTLAMALSYRPANRRKRTVTKQFTVDLLRDVGYSLVPQALVSKIDGSRQKVLKCDVHGNPLWQSQDAENIRIRIVRCPDDNKLRAVITDIGDFKWQWALKGLFGKPCACRNADPNKRIINRQFQGIRLYDIFCHSLHAQMNTIAPFNALMLYWVTGDVPLAIAKSGTVTNPYIQVFGECLHCAVKNSIAFGCTVVIAGGS